LARLCITCSSLFCIAGIPEELLIGQVQALTPQQAKALIELMTAQGVLKQQAITQIPETAVPSIFGPSQPVNMLVSCTASIYYVLCHLADRQFLHMLHPDTGRSTVCVLSSAPSLQTLVLDHDTHTQPWVTAGDAPLFCSSWSRFWPVV